MLYQHLQTLKEQLQDLNPKKARWMQSTGEIDKLLERFKDQMKSARRVVALEARIKKIEHPCVALKVREQAVRKTQEVKMGQILEELGYLFQQSNVFTR